MNAAIPSSRKMMTRSQMRPIPHIIAMGMSVICIVFERASFLFAIARKELDKQFRCSSPRDGCHAASSCLDIREACCIG